MSQSGLLGLQLTMVTHRKFANRRCLGQTRLFSNSGNARGPSTLLLNTAHRTLRRLPRGRWTHTTEVTASGAAWPNYTSCTPFLSFSAGTPKNDCTHSKVEGRAPRLSMLQKAPGSSTLLYAVMPHGCRAKGPCFRLRGLTLVCYPVLPARVSEALQGEELIVSVLSPFSGWQWYATKWLIFLDAGDKYLY